MRVLLTGAAGSIGRVVTVGLADRGHRVIGLDRVVEPEGFDGPWHSVDCADPDAVAVGLRGRVARRRRTPRGAPGRSAACPTSLTSHVVTTAALLDAMVEHDAQRIVYASSNHAVGRTPRPADPSTRVSDDARPRPDTFYGVAKVAAEALLSLYADRYGLDAVSCRIGSFQPQPETTRHLSTWLSHDDCVRMVEAALTTAAPGYAVLYGISREHPPLVGPRARPRGWATNPWTTPRSSPPPWPPDPRTTVEAAHVGGPFAGEAFYRPALDRS